MGDDHPGKVLSRRQAVAAIGIPAVTWFAGCSGSSDDGTKTPGSTENSGERSTTGATSGGGTETTRRTSAGETETTQATATESPATAEWTPSPTATGRNGCIAKPEQATGPYYQPDESNPERSDLRTDTKTGTRKDGVPLSLDFEVFDIASEGCVPHEGAVVDVWSTDALGVYSDVESQDTTDGSTEGQDFMRGHQFTDGDGVASFTTVIPGWYPGRTPHVHFTVRRRTRGAGFYDFTSQLFFHEELLETVYQRDPYRSRGEPDTSNDEDTVFYPQLDPELYLELEEDGDGYAATFAVALHTD